MVAVCLAGSFLLGMVSPSLAAETTAPLMDPKPTLAAAAAAKVESIGNEALVAVAQATPAPESADGGRFFKSGKGRAALVFLVAATGFTVYSKYHDRIKSVIR